MGVRLERFRMPIHTGFIQTVTALTERRNPTRKETVMTKRDYARKAELLAELASLEIRDSDEGNFNIADEYLDRAKSAIKKMRETHE